MSLALDFWLEIQSSRLDEFEGAHKAVGGSGRGRRFATQQINRAYAVLLAAQFQAFCRLLHDECTRALIGSIPSADLQVVARANFFTGLAMDRGNANPGNIGSDFGRLGLKLWDELNALNPKNALRNKQLNELNVWRNANVHEDFRDRGTFPAGQRTILRLPKVREWRRTCDSLASDMDGLMHGYVGKLMGRPPW
ncbi:MAG: hypothetical protein GEV13_23235 [Rhodospirillales bacterium]|nr:hypothetical protein [Rhodospirillales bacterium]